MQNIYWGINQKKNNKRKLDELYEFDDSDVYSRKLNDIKKSKLFNLGNKRIYVVGKEIHFTEKINDDTIENIIRKITKIINEHNKDYEGGDEKLEITYIVDSPGGSISSILKFVDYIKLAKKKYPYLEFISIITGTCASAGTIMCIIADKRYATEHSVQMLHELSSGNSGKYTFMKSYTEHLTALHNTLINIYLHRCKKTRNELEDILSNETWFNAKEYLEAGFIDEIV